MLKNSKILILMLIMSSFMVISCNAASITAINDLIEKAADLNGVEVTIQGEAIGEALERGDYAWINISDGANAIGVWVDRAETKQIQFYGDYKHKGDIVRVTGVFYKACTEHGGDVDIHCMNLKEIEAGHVVTEAVTHPFAITAAIMTAITTAVIIAYLKFWNIKKKK